MYVLLVIGVQPVRAGGWWLCCERENTAGRWLLAGSGLVREKSSRGRGYPQIPNPTDKDMGSSFRPRSRSRARAQNLARGTSRAQNLARGRCLLPTYNTRPIKIQQHLTQAQQITLGNMNCQHNHGTTHSPTSLSICRRTSHSSRLGDGADGAATQRGAL
jgi:hypothetical protein